MLLRAVLLSNTLSRGFNTAKMSLKRLKDMLNPSPCRPFSNYRNYIAAFLPATFLTGSV
jgi:hypothetical protein